ncbi:MAG: YbhB/YbcL family Raf kinase inhibitor-like protein [candidate division Zixibacteria bacterium]|nr:YbhB/YbcL family Raf kinase inhibitor-like protein [candidate division Zixibacteria bacterium]
MKKTVFIPALLLLLIIVHCGKSDSDRQSAESDQSALMITSPAFAEGETIPVQYTCDSVDVSPPLVFANIPDGAKSLALICDDPDAPVGNWVHWVMFNIPPDMGQLPEDFGTSDWHVKIIDSTVAPIIHGMTDFGRCGYGGPCPPPGKPHRYYFKLYALETVLVFDDNAIDKGVTKEALLDKMSGHILEDASLMGKYGR